MNKKIASGVILAALLGGSIYFFANREKTVTYNCADGKYITATFYLPADNYVRVLLSDGRALFVPHAISASGARYATPDESFVFWNKGDTAFILENNQTTYQDCAYNAPQ